MTEASQAPSSGLDASSHSVTFPTDRSWPAFDEVGEHWDVTRLGSAVDDLRDAGTASVIVLDRGRLVLERHWGVDGDRQLDDVASVQKSLIAVLVGIAVDQGLLAPDDAVARHLGTSWSKAGPVREEAITVAHLLSMTSGLSPTLDFVADPGEQWSYNTVAYQMLKPVLVAAAGLDLATLTRTWLTEPIGMEDTAWVEREPMVLPEATPDAVLLGLQGQGFVRDPDGRWAHRMPDGSLVTGLVTTAHDLARLGLLLAAGGSWLGSRVVSTAWLDQATRPSQQRNPAYGHLFWIGGQPGVDAFDRPFDRFEPAAPDDLVAARGANQQLVDVSAASGLVLVRTAMLGAAATGSTPATNISERLWSAVSDARR